MKFSAREDIDAPIESVFDAVSDFDAFERRMLRRGVDIVRDNAVPLDEVGACWKAKVSWRGRVYDVDAELVAPERRLLEAASRGLWDAGEEQLDDLGLIVGRMVAGQGGPEGRAPPGPCRGARRTAARVGQVMAWRTARSIS